MIHSINRYSGIVIPQTFQFLSFDILFRCAHCRPIKSSLFEYLMATTGVIIGHGSQPLK